MIVNAFRLAVKFFHITRKLHPIDVMFYTFITLRKSMTIKYTQETFMYTKVSLSKTTVI